jgi:hypothetical protein
MAAASRRRKKLTIVNSFESQGKRSSQASEASQGETISRDINVFADEERDDRRAEGDDLGAERDDRRAESTCGGTIQGDDCGTLSEGEASHDNPLGTKETPTLTEAQDGRDDAFLPLSDERPHDDSDWREDFV